MPDWERLLGLAFWGNGLVQWVIAALAFGVTFTVLPLLRGYVIAKQRSWKADRVHDGVELVALLVSRTSRFVLWVVAIGVASAMLDLPPRVERGLKIVLVLAFWLQAGAWAVTSVRFMLDRHRGKSGSVDVARSGSFEIVMFLARLLIFALVFILALDNLGVNISALLAGLGIGGIAIALAVQTVLSDLFASLSIAFDKPFEVGDALQVDNETGTVERIGIKSTRLRATSGEQIIISNADLLKSRVHNHKRLHERRYAFTVNVTYDTPVETVRRIPRILEAAVRVHEPQVRFDRSHFARFADFALVFETVYFVLSPDYNLFMGIQQDINVRLLEQFEAEGIRFAFPTQTLNVEGAVGALAAESSQPQ